MFGKFGGIVIIALSGAIIAGLILRPTPDLPPAMSLGVPDTSVSAANTLETTVDNQDKKPAAIEPVTDTIESTESKSESADKAEEEPSTAETEKPTEMTADKAKAAVEKATAEASEVVDKVMTKDDAKEGIEKSE